MPCRLRNTWARSLTSPIVRTVGCAGVRRPGDAVAYSVRPWYWPASSAVMTVSSLTALAQQVKRIPERQRLAAARR